MWTTSKLRHIVTFFMYCRMAYPMFKADLHAAIDVSKDSIEHPKMKMGLMELRDLLEFFIPAVLCFSFFYLVPADCLLWVVCYTVISVDESFSNTIVG